MLRFLAFAYALVAYLVGMGALALFAAFLLGFDLLPRTSSAAGLALAVDMALVALFGLQHSVMARPGFKRAWTAIMPRPVERATYVFTSGVALGALLAFWRPIEGSLWEASGVGLVAAYGLFAVGALVLLGSSFMIDHFELFGLKQAWRAGARRPTTSEFRVVLLYRLVRHPIMLGILIMLWAAPRMTIDHLALSLGLTAYILIALRFEEHDLVEAHGDDYRRYREAVPQLLPRLGTPWRDSDAVGAGSARSGD